MKSDNLAENEVVRINTPNGIVVLSHLRGIGTSVHVYRDADSNPIVTVFVDEASAK